MKPTQVKKSKGDAANAEDAKARADLRRALEALDDESPRHNRSNLIQGRPGPCGRRSASPPTRWRGVACLAAREHLVEVEAKAKAEWIDPRPKETGPRWVPPTKVIQLRGDAALAADARGARGPSAGSSRPPRRRRDDRALSAEEPYPEETSSTTKVAVAEDGRRASWLRCDA